MTAVDVLCLGWGWTGQFLPAAFEREKIEYAFTVTSSASLQAKGLDEAVASRHRVFSLGGEDWQKSVSALPRARMVVVIFPLKETATVDALVDAYEAAHGAAAWLLLGSTGIWKDGRHTSRSPIDPANARGQAEAHLLAHKGPDAAVLNLAGLYGLQREPRNFILKAAPTLEALEQKSSLHLVHGDDVARAIAAMYSALSDPRARAALWGRRWIVSDTHVYDWWHLAGVVPGLRPEYGEWSAALAAKHGVALPRPPASDGDGAGPATLKRALDGTEFWAAAGVDLALLHGRFYETENR